MSEHEAAEADGMVRMTSGAVMDRDAWWARIEYGGRSVTCEAPTAAAAQKGAAAAATASLGIDVTVDRVPRPSRRERRAMERQARNDARRAGKRAGR